MSTARSDLARPPLSRPIKRPSALGARFGRMPHRVAIVGAAAISQALAEIVTGTPHLGMELVGMFDGWAADDDRQQQTNAAAVAGSFSALLALCHRGAVDRVYVPLSIGGGEPLKPLIEQLADTRVAVDLVPDFTAVDLLHGRVRKLDGIWTLSVFDTPMAGLGGVAKRVMDVLLSGAILVAVAPVMLAVALGVRLSSPGPVIFKQRRGGLDGSQIVVWKFRTMTVTEDGDTIMQARRHGDPRVTRLGAFLRRCHLDELPQFINVLQGRMSIVGPRPHAIAHNETYRRLVPSYMLRHRVRPGITGWAQVNGWSGETEQLHKMQKRVEHDLWYIRNWSPGLDLRIIAGTVVRVLSAMVPSRADRRRAADRAPGPSVLLLVENLPVPLDRRVWLEAKSLRDRGYRVSVICPRMYGHTKRFERLDGIDVYRFPVLVESDGLAGYLVEYGSALAMMLWYAVRVWLRSGIDVIHVANPPDLLALVALPFKPFGTRVIYDQHDLCPELLAAKGRDGRLMRAVIRGLERLSYRIADAVIVPNESYRHVALTRGGRNPDTVFVVRNGPLRDALAPRRSVPRERLVGYVGVMGDQDDIDVLLEVAARLKASHPDLRYRLLGDGTGRARFEAFARELGVDDRVEFTGMVAEDRIADLLAPCSVCVVPDRVNDFTARSTMNKVMEYMALEKPIVQFDTPEGRFSARESSLYARPNDVVDLADKIAALIDDPPLAHRMGRLGRARFLRRLHWGCSVATLHAAYDRVLGAAPVAVPAVPAVPRPDAGRTVAKAPAPDAARPTARRPVAAGSVAGRAEPVPPAIMLTGQTKKQPGRRRAD